MDNKKTGQFIQALRKEKGLTQKELAEKLGYSDKAISRWETGLGLPDVAILLDLSQVLGVSVNEILRGEKLVPELKGEDMESGGLAEKVMVAADETVVEVLKDSQIKIKRKNKETTLFCVLCVLQMLALYVVPQIISAIVPTAEPIVSILCSTVFLCIIAGIFLGKIKWIYPLFVSMALFAAIPFSGSDYYIYASIGAYALAISYGIVALCHGAKAFVKMLGIIEGGNSSEEN